MSSPLAMSPAQNIRIQIQIRDLAERRGISVEEATRLYESERTGPDSCDLLLGDLCEAIARTIAIQSHGSVGVGYDLNLTQFTDRILAMDCPDQAVRAFKVLLGGPLSTEFGTLMWASTSFRMRAASVIQDRLSDLCAKYPAHFSDSSTMVPAIEAIIRGRR